MSRIIVGLALLLVACSEAAAQGAPYTLQAGDSIEITVLEDQKLNRQVIIAPDGMISFPLVGQLRAGGLSVKALEAQLTKRLSKNYLTPPTVTVMLAQIGAGATSRIYITGEVNNPGPYAISPETSVVQAIALSGGLGKFASKRRIQIHRRVAGKEEVYLFNYSDFLAGKNLQGNILLKPGDVIVVPERGLF